LIGERAPRDQDTLELTFPIIGLSAEKKPLSVCGTAFSIGGDMYLTAGHVWDNALIFPLRAIGVREHQAPNATLFQISDREIIAAFDLAILKTLAPAPDKALIWSSKDLILFANVRTFGYPYGFDLEVGTLGIRGLQGHIVGGTTFHRLSGKPPVYELSFACPRGLSGAPLVWQDSQPRGHVHGLVLTNHITEMTVFTETEKLIAAGQEKTLIKTEALHLGIAIRSSAVLGVHSAFLGCTIAEWLRAHELLVTE
jgi:hypothetical protein